MSRDVLKPIFLTEDIAVAAIVHISPLISKLYEGGVLERDAFAVIVLVPSLDACPENLHRSSRPSVRTKPYVLLEWKEGEASWPYPFDKIARSKALELWYGRNNGGTDCMPHLLFPGDTPYWGGVKRDGIVVTCSAFEQHLDQMVAGMVADFCIGMAYHKWASVRESFDGNFLSEAVVGQSDA